MDAISLFSGAGGFEIGFERAGIQTVLQAESDPWCRQVLERHWPDVEHVTDVRKLSREHLWNSGLLQGDDMVTGNKPGVSHPVTVRAKDNGVVEGVWSANTFRNDVVSVTQCHVPSTVHTPVSEIPPDREVPSVLVGVGLPLVNDVALSAVPSAETPPVGQLSRSRHRENDTSLSIDLVYGGWPCQGNSVAGKRAGLSDERSGLWAEVRRVLSELRPTYFVGENVPGLLSVNRGRDWAEILMDLEHLGYGWAYRVLDARWFGVPQRRRRVFVVGCLGDEARAAQVLAVCESCGGHPAPRQEAGEGLADAVESSIAGTLGSHHGNVRADQAWTGQLVARALTAPNGSGRGGSYRLDDQENIVVANGLRASDGHHGHSSPRGDGADNLVAFEPMGVRRLTPLECERLMGWPDEWTRWTADGREIPDSHRYRLCGNGVVSTVAEWIGHRLVAVDGMRLPHADTEVA